MIPAHSPVSICTVIHTSLLSNTSPQALHRPRMPARCFFLVPGGYSKCIAFKWFLYVSHRENPPFWWHACSTVVILLPSLLVLLLLLLTLVVILLLLLINNGHRNGASPLCDFLCLNKSLGRANPRLHTSHLCGLPPTAEEFGC